ncbi:MULTISPECIES: DUF1801 domain-containing protein [unclassified Nocardioides]|uniref:DUF1801 domain-containing protein n=1 Tax=unclassified Nocardioides TaxID=2615069 RepID=UPI0006F73F98|nr:MULTISPECIES: DUF1801 domain-containing protein [unclassified Nocardioides]KQY62500.1 hypothetical protein ASD30_24380 [Nocardioides sp. Root140]KQZ70553.1 hypothetical protein ASD66_13215 [Nocardioides sp. Root151]KRF16949.1 hypothetical protein ASH02_02535 [Nocardioides sp. Soil796]
MSSDTSYDGFTKEERAAMKERAAELKSAKKRSTSPKKAEADRADLAEKIAAMTADEQAIATKLDEIVTANAPDLLAKTWYGMPAWHRDGKIILFFKNASKFDVRYSEVGFNEHAALDDGDMWPTCFAVTTTNATIEKALTELVKKAAG